MDDNSTIFDIVLYIGYFLVVLAVLAAVLLPLVKAANDPRSLITMGAGLLALIIIFAIGYALSDNEVLALHDRAGITENGSKVIGGTIITMYILIGIALLSIAVTEISKLIR